MLQEENSEQIRVLITGAAGCLGRHLLATAPTNIQVTALIRSASASIPTTMESASISSTIQVELSDREKVLEVFSRIHPRIVIHTAYGTTDLHRDVTLAGRNVVDACAAIKCWLIHISSDLVLDGANGAPYGDSFPANPIVPYGHAKSDLESYVKLVLPHSSSIVRTSLIIGVRVVNSSSEWILEKLRRGESAFLFVDELRCPILADDLALMLWELAEKTVGDGTSTAVVGGTWNLVGPEAMSRFAIGLILARAYGLPSELVQPRWSDQGGVSSPPRPRDLRMTTIRASKELSKCRARPISCLPLLLLQKPMDGLR